MTERSLVQRQFGDNAASYAASTVHAQGESLARTVELVRPQKSWRVLDIATGAGHMAAAFAPHVREVVATDITEEMLAETRALASDRGLDNLTTAPAEAGNLGFDANSFDAVVCRLAAHHFPDIPAFLAQAARVLKPGGTFALVDNVGPDATTLPYLEEQECRQIGLVYNTFEKLRDPSHGRILLLEEWQREIERAGLKISNHEQFSKEMGFDAWTARMRCDPPTITLLREMLTEIRGLSAFLQPREVDGRLRFSLQEAIIVAENGAI